VLKHGLIVPGHSGSVSSAARRMQRAGPTPGEIDGETFEKGLILVRDDQAHQRKSSDRPQTGI
jgi:hypothetical protein